ncbi:primosomal protein N' [Erysipelothrix rhusiopathiae]|nr:primosomal protein N' [Erysipelothrix rhusiopathiae]MDE8068312.1 primosomal protein N' [Erysipelothrix rhusiopathiae]MDE8114124.1 primosomal protein N' [Erysipelothrix rhusiopathiae]MDE8207237.1 primosomal protein N' [Erysipelothrix rhusiopathiae]MDE8301817.1 primosomal protein N' [Erysipelothrix rhusiopathiae]
MKSLKYLEVYIEESFLNNQTLTYSDNGFDVSPGVRVMVRVRNRLMVAFVHSVKEPYETTYTVAPIDSVLDEVPILNQELDDLALWMSYEYMSPMIRCLQTILPNKLKPKSSAGTIKTERVLKLTGHLMGADLTPKQRAFLKYLDQNTPLSLKAARHYYSDYRKLIEKGFVEEFEREVTYQEQFIKADYLKPTLTPDQIEALNKIKFGVASTYLLHGVTGSGKTEIYLNAAAQVLKEQKQVLIMVPEISLTPQMIQRVSERFGEDVAIYHSALNDQEKYEQYVRVQKQQVKIVIGTRSSIFMPFEHLGLIVMDEEHDSSYKQDQVPMYHTRDIAIKRSQFHNCPLVLGSASPALESYARALKGNYQLLELNDRINHTFPTVTLVDTRTALYEKQSPYLTHTLLSGIKKRLSAGEQVILLLNRRGYNTLLKNAKTNEVLLCEHCDVALNYHKDDQTIRCHMCGESYHQLPLVDGKPPKIIGSGVGTQRLVEELEGIFPKARIARMDADTTSKKNAHQRILNDFINHQSDILVGTQMIAKGLDVENVTLVGIVNADATLAYSDYRSVELTFNMILQAAGRSGRGQYPGEVIIQTSNPDHYAIVCAVNQKYKHFFKQEMEYRKIAGYPPYNYLISLVFLDEVALKSWRAAEDFQKLLNDQDFQILGPTELRKLQRKHRTRIILKGKNLESMINICNQALQLYRKINGTGVVVDVNPITLE